MEGLPLLWLMTREIMLEVMMPYYDVVRMDGAHLETMTKELVSVNNYLTPDQEYLRPSLLPQLINCAEENLRWFNEFNIFELGRIFLDKPGELSVDGTTKTFLPKYTHLFY